jgi:hypothetical protein
MDDDHVGHPPDEIGVLEGLHGRMNRGDRKSDQEAEQNQDGDDPFFHLPYRSYPRWGRSQLKDGARFFYIMG